MTAKRRDRETPAGTARVTTTSAKGARAAAETLLISEEPLLFALKDEQLLTMRTPGDDESLALGFLLTEGVIGRAADVLSLKLYKKGGAAPPLPSSRPPEVDVLAIELAKGAKLGNGRLSRAHEIRPSCGICGAASAEGLVSGLPRLASGRPRVTIGGLLSFLAAMQKDQRLFKETGGCHAAALFSTETGKLLTLGEDVGRHNAVDKAIGRAARAGQPFAGAALVLSGRGGFELVLKALRVGLPIVASVSAPTSLAVEIAQEAGATLVGFLREGGTPTVYADDGRLA